MNRTEKEETVFGNILILANKLNQLGDSIIPDITFKQWFLLLVISKIDTKEKNINKIAEMAGSTRQNIKKMLTPLEEKGYVVIANSQHDLRSLAVELTKKSYDYFENIVATTSDEINSLFSLFSNNELDCFMSGIQTLQTCIEKYSERAERYE